MRKTTTDPMAYIASLPDDMRTGFETLDTLITGIMEGHSRVMWEGVFWGGTEQSIIGYGDLTMTQSKGRKIKWFMVGLVLQKNHISVYVSAVEDGQYVAEKYKSELGKVKVGKASIAIKRLDDVNLDTLARVVTIARDQLTTPH
jgi:hypothetical protein